MMAYVAKNRVCVGQEINENKVTGEVAAEVTACVKCVAHDVAKNVKCR